ncbi:hypothetical protein K2173_000839 [Erythroxylum novogranatense]|uniref:Transmembrane protein n=1 Tax=Erythroxylum novogranatense TaxID=1862640 RepID=A0AAV8S7U7_9ROSI|nr:hypothetical protein K2173_000839 [Erythroxylum novogranatense]
MGWQNWQKLLNYAVFTEAVGVVAVTLLSLLIPLSFFAIAKLCSYNYLVTVTSDIEHPSSSFLFSFVLYINPAILYVLGSIVSVATLVHGLTGKAFLILIHDATGRTYKPCLYAAWITLTTLQFCVGTGIAGTQLFGIDNYSFENGRSLLCRIIFFLGLHETMLQWFRAVIKPVVDHTVFGVSRDETWVQRVTMALAFGTLWGWRLGEEVDSLVIVAGAKMGLVMPLGVADLIGWWLYYLTFAIGVVKIIKSLFRFCMLIHCRRVCKFLAEPDWHEEKV